MSSALRQQYGLRTSSREFAEMPWEEFSDLLCGLSGDTALASVVRVRTTTDKNVLEQLTPEQRAMRAEWQRRRALNRSADENRAALDALQRALMNAFGGG